MSFLFLSDLCCLFFFDIQILIVPLVFSCVFYFSSFSVLSFLIDPSIFSDVYILPEDNVVEDLRILITHLVSSSSFQ